MGDGYGSYGSYGSYGGYQPGPPKVMGSGYFLCPEMGVSKNRGTPKSSILIGFSIINHPFWGTPIFGNTQMYANHVETLWIQVLYLRRRYFTPPNCTLSVVPRSYLDP